MMNERARDRYTGTDRDGRRAKKNNWTNKPRKLKYGTQYSWATDFFFQIQFHAREKQCDKTERECVWSWMDKITTVDTRDTDNDNNNKIESFIHLPGSDNSTPLLLFTFTAEKLRCCFEIHVDCWLIDDKQKCHCFIFLAFALVFSVKLVFIYFFLLAFKFSGCHTNGCWWEDR